MRQWRAPTAGMIHITGNASDGDPNCGDGVIASIKKGTQALWQQTIDNGNTAGFNYDLTTAVVAGDQINFVINKRIANNWCDSTTFDPTITYVNGGNQSPIANIGGPYSGTVGNAVSFNGSNSYDPDGSIANYSWAFGDGGAGSGATPAHGYTSEGIYAAALTVAALSPLLWPSRSARAAHRSSSAIMDLNFPRLARAPIATCMEQQAGCGRLLGTLA